MTNVIIDGDTLVYRCGFSVEHRTYRVSGGPEEVGTPLFDNKKAAKEFMDKYPDTAFEVEHICEVEPLSHALGNIKTVLETIMDGQFPNARRMSLYISGGENFRKKIDPTYKANRDNMIKPKYFNEIREYLIQHWKAISVLGIEADDAMSIAAYAWLGAYCIVTNDKDLNQVPGHHYNWVKNEHSFVTPEEAEWNLYAQILSGDATDNVRGLGGFGPRRAATALGVFKDVRTLERKVYKEYKKVYGDQAKEQMGLTGSLVYLLRAPNDKFELSEDLDGENKNTKEPDPSGPETEGEVRPESG